MPDWSGDVWVSLGIGAAGLIVAAVAWLFPRSPRESVPAAEPAPPVPAETPRAPAVEPDPELVVATFNHLPVAVLPDGRHTSGEWLVAVTLYDRGEWRVC